MISVIIPVRDCARVLPCQLAALARQEGSALGEVLVADNGSHDDSVSVARSWAPRLPSLRIIDASAKPGAGFARNTAARSALHPRLAFCDADDVVGPHWAQGMAEGLEKAGLVTGPVDLFALNPAPVARARLAVDRDLHEGTHIAGWLPFGLGGNLGVTRAAFESVGGFDECLLRSQDVDFCWRVQLAGHPLLYEPRATISYRIPTSFWATFHRARRYNQWFPYLYRRFKPHGFELAPFTLRAMAHRWWGTLRPAVSQMRSRQGRLTLAFALGQSTGLAIGSLRHRTPVA